MKKIITLVMATVFAAFIMTSCGGNGNKKSTTETKPQTEKKEVKKEVKKETGTSIKGMTANLEDGKKIYNKYCIACHMTGVAGAAKLDNKERWTESANKGLQTLVDHAVHGYQGKHGVLPEKGTCMECNTQNIYDAISYMLNKAGVAAK
jgi:cytochrome c5